MGCFSEEIIQQYIDRECTTEEALSIEKHILGCSDCRKKVELCQKRSDDIKRSMNALLNDDTSPVIPPFVRPVKRFTRLRKSMVVAAGIAAIIGMVHTINISFQQKEATKYILYQTMDFNIDANQPISEQEFTMQYIDESGNIMNLDTNLF